MSNWSGGSGGKEGMSVSWLWSSLESKMEEGITTLD